MHRISALHVGKYFPPVSGGIESFLADLLGALAEDGIRVFAVVHDDRLRRRGEIAKWPADDLLQAGSATDERSPVTLYRAPSLGRLLYAPVSPQFPFWLRRAIRAERPDVLHLHLPNTSAFWALFLPEARRIPWVIHWHADVVASDIDRRLKLAYPLYRPFEQKLLQKATAVIATSPPYLKGSRALAPWRDKCRVVPLGLAPSRVAKPSDNGYREAEQWWDGAGFRILSVGRLTYYKGHEYLVRALNDLPGARVVIVGEGERRALLENIIFDLGLNERAVLTGNVQSEVLHGLMETCDCMCLPSIERTEAFGMVLLEAMAHRKPTVVCDIGGSGVSWVVQNGETGYVVPPADPATLCETFRALSADRDSSSRMGLQGWHRYQDMFRIDRISGEIAAIYRSVNDIQIGQ